MQKIQLTQIILNKKLMGMRGWGYIGIELIRMGEHL